MRTTGRQRCGSNSSIRLAGWVGSLSSTSINRTLSKALLKVAPDDLEFTEIPIRDLPLYSQDFDADFPPPARALKQAIEALNRDTDEFAARRMDAGIKRALSGRKIGSL